MNLSAICRQFKAWIKRFAQARPTEAELKRIEMERRITEAKKAVRCFVGSSGIIYVENYDEVRLILGYEDTLGMALFIRHWIAKDAPTDKCLAFLGFHTSAKP